LVSCSGIVYLIDLDKITNSVFRDAKMDDCAHDLVLHGERIGVQREKTAGEGCIQKEDAQGYST
ncbi:MAG: hypothetical protein ACWGQW_11010, partial [bacterium]